jgi:hypothetical protein
MTIRLTPDEKDTLNTMARRLGTNRANVIKDALFWFEHSDHFKQRVTAFFDFLQEQFDTPLYRSKTNGTTQHKRN